MNKRISFSLFFIYQIFWGFPLLLSGFVFCLVANANEIVSELLSSRGGSTRLDGGIVVSYNDGELSSDGNYTLLLVLGVNTSVINLECEVFCSLNVDTVGLELAWVVEALGNLLNLGCANL